MTQEPDEEAVQRLVDKIEHIISREHRLFVVALQVLLTLLLLGLALFLGAKHAHAAADSYLLKEVTMYQPKPEQTDGDPWRGAFHRQLKRIMRKGDLGLSRDLLRRWGGPFDWGDTVRLTPEGKADSRCAGEFIVADVMNRRWKRKADVFILPSEKAVTCKRIRLELVKKRAAGT